MSEMRPVLRMRSRNATPSTDRFWFVWRVGGTSSRRQRLQQLSPADTFSIYEARAIDARE